MKFKTVHGLGRADYAKKALEAALANLHSPKFVDAWLEWFDKQPADTDCHFTKEQLSTYTASELQAANPVMLDQCAHCTPGVVCPDDCPQPEFYPCDLEEVAHAVVSRVEAELVIFLRSNAPLMTCPPLPLELQNMLNLIRGELSEPGYVEGLLPQ